jgi:ATP-dependent protease HslVU (ClpYQ) peptidase subunit
MTCALAIKDNDKVVMVADRSCDFGYYMETVDSPKIFEFDMPEYKMLISYAGTMRGATLLKHSFVPPTWDKECPMESYVTIDLMDSIRECWEEHNFVLDMENNQCEMIVAISDFDNLYLYNVGSDLAVTTSVHPYMSIGTGAVFALGVLCGMELTKLGTDDKARLAMRSADTWCNTVQGPFDVVTLAKDGNVVFSG